MSETITVGLGSRSYDIHVGPGLITETGALLAPLARGPVPVVTDDHVAKLHLDRVLDALFAQRIDARAVTVEAGEATKSFRSLENLTDALLSTGVDRGGLIVAL